MKILLLAAAALPVAGSLSVANAEPGAPLVLAQAQKPAEQAKPDQQHRPAPPAQAKPQPAPQRPAAPPPAAARPPAPAQPHQAQPQPQQRQAPPPQQHQAQPPRPPSPPTHAAPAAPAAPASRPAPHPTTAQPHSPVEPRRPGAAPATAPAQRPAPTAREPQAPNRPTPPSAQRPAGAAPAAGQPQHPAAGARPSERPGTQQPAAPRSAGEPQRPAGAPAGSGAPQHPTQANPPRPGTAAPNAPATQQRPATAAPNAPATQQRPATAAPNAPGTPPQKARPQPPAAQQPQPQPQPQPSAQIPPTPPNNPPHRLEDAKRDRKVTRENGRTVISEPGRVIVRENGHTIIHHNEVERFRRNARDVRVEHRGNDTFTIVVRPDNSRIVNVVDDRGRLLRRIRREPNGREIVLIDNTRSPRDGRIFLNLAPPVVHIPRDRYIVEADRADRALVYDTLIAPPVEPVERSYTLDEIRYNQNLRERMPRIDLDTITFDTGSWDISPDEARRLDVIAAGIRRAVDRNPREIFLIEGHTDAIGADIDNLSLSDRRAEAVAEVLTRDYGIPPENLTTQGYGEQYLKVPTDGPERRNRRVTVRRITPLLTGQNP